MSYWLKLWTDVLDDPKLMAAQRTGAKHLVLLPWLLAFAKRAGDNGRLSVGDGPALAPEIARSIPNTKKKHVEHALRELESIGVLERDEDGVLRFVNWEFRQQKKPSDDKAAVKKRVREHRERKKRESAGAPVTARNALQPVEERHDVTPRNAIDGDGDGDGVTDGDGETAPPRAIAPVAVGELPPAAHELLDTFYSADRDRRRDAEQQILDTLSPRGALLADDQRVRAYSRERLAAACRKVMRDRFKLRDPDMAIVVLLKKLGDTSDGSAPGAREAAQLRIEERDDETELRKVRAWIATRPDVAAKLEAAAGPAPDEPIARTARQLRLDGMQTGEWRRAGRPGVDASTAGSGRVA